MMYLKSCVKDDLTVEHKITGKVKLTSQNALWLPLFFILPPLLFYTYPTLPPSLSHYHLTHLPSVFASTFLSTYQNSTPYFIKSDGLFITKPFEVANYSNDYLIGKVGKLRQEIPPTNREQIYSCTKKLIMQV